MSPFFAQLYKWVLFIMLFSSLYCTKSFGEEINGIHFRTKDYGIEERTGIDVTRYGPLKYNREFSIRFEISFRNYPSLYGKVLQLKDTQNKHRLALMSTIDEDSPDLFVLFNNQITDLKIDLTQKQIKDLNHRHTIELTVNARSQLATLQFDGEEVSDSLSFPGDSELNLIFGTVSNYGFQSYDVPAMSIRNIQYLNQGQLTYSWPLFPSDKNVLKDTLDNKKIEIHNPRWENIYHYAWEHIDSFEVKGIPQVAYNSDDENLYLVLKNGDLKVYDFIKRELKSIAVSGMPAYEVAQQACFNNRGELCTYSFSKNSISIFDSPNLAWMNSSDPVASLPKYWHHNKFIHPGYNSLTTFGGYGFYTFCNTFQIFNKETNRFRQLAMTGDTITPRYLSSLGIDGTTVYIFGGIGNQSGNQIQEKQFFYDLYKVDLLTNRIEKVWDLSINNNFTPLNSMIIDSERDDFYTLCFPHNKTKTTLQLIKASLNKPTWEYYGSQIPYKFQDIKSFANLYHWKSNNKLIVFTLSESKKDSYTLNLYTLNFPPAKNIALTKQSQGKTYNIFLVVPVIILVLLIFMILVRKGKKKKQSTVTDDSLPDKKPENQSKILLFGGLSFIMPDGEDITNRFTPVLKDLFLLIYFHSRHENKGVSSLQIHESLWPDKSPQSAKNNRGVNIKKLRLLLEELGDVNIVYDKKLWWLSYGKDIFCDLDFIAGATSSLKPLPKEELNKVLDELQKGDFLMDFRNEIFDGYKDNITGMILNFLEKLCEHYDLKSESQLLLRITETIFIFDRLNETALRYKCKILSLSGKHMLAHDAYDHFQALYVKLYNEKFDIAFKDLIE